MARPSLIVFASGSATGGGSGFEKLVEATIMGVLDARIVAVVSNHKEGGVKERAGRLFVPFIHFPGPWTAEKYQRIVSVAGADFTALSGWLKFVVGLNARTTFNIHPALLPEFGGAGMYGHHVHEAVLSAFQRGEITHSGVSMHFVTGEYDRGPVFFQKKVELLPGDTADDIGKRVNAVEHEFQARITSLVVHREISWDGEHPESLQVPTDYKYLPDGQI